MEVDIPPVAPFLLSHQLQGEKDADREELRTYKEMVSMDVCRPCACIHTVVSVDVCRLAVCMCHTVVRVDVCRPCTCIHTVVRVDVCIGCVHTGEGGCV